MDKTTGNDQGSQTQDDLSDYPTTQEQSTQQQPIIGTPGNSFSYKSDEGKGSIHSESVSRKSSLSSRKRSITFAPQLNIDIEQEISSETGDMFNTQSRSQTFASFSQDKDRLSHRRRTLPALPGRNSLVTRSIKPHSPTDILDEKGCIENKGTRRASISISPRSQRSNSNVELSTDKLQKIISEKIIGQITNSQRRHSISSNQKTSILKNYTRMLQNELQLDERPDSDSPDFSETPFMRSSTKPIQEDQQETNDSNNNDTSYTKDYSLWGKYFHYGQFRSKLSYSEIEEEDTLGAKARRRLSATFYDGAGILTRKEKALKLKIKQQPEFVHQEEEEEGHEGDE